METQRLPSPVTDQVYTPGEIAQMLKCSDNTVRNYIQRGLIPAFSIGHDGKGGDLRVWKKDLLRVLRKNRVGPIYNPYGRRGKPK